MERGTKLYALLLLCIGLCLPEVLLSKSTLPIPLFKRDVVQESRWNSLRSNVRVAVLEYEPAQYQKLKQQGAEELTISLPTAAGDLKLNLVQNKIFTEDFILNTDKATNLPYSRGLHYKGHVEGQPNSMVAISFYDDEVAAVVNTVEGNKFVVGHSNAFRRESFVVYDASKISGPAMDCSSEELPNYEERLHSIKQQVLEQRSADKCVRIYFELGKSVFDNKGGAAGAADYISSVFNFVAALYANEQITVVISEIFVWSTNEPYSTSSTTNALYNFGSAKKDNFNGDLAQFVRLKPSGSMSGVAWLDVLCYNYFGLSQSGRFSVTEVLPTFASLPTYSWSVEVVTHELGHNLGSPHTQSCTWTGGPIDNCAATEGGCPKGPAPTNGGTIMSYCHLTSYGINFNNGFGPKPGARIRDRVNAAACLGQCAASVACNPPSGLSVTNITSNAVTLNWASSGASAYAVQYKNTNTSTWTTATSSTTSLSFNLTGLAVGSNYNWQVKSICGSSSSGYTAGTFSTNSSSCVSTAPSNLSSSNNSSSSTTVSWSAVSGANSYEVQYKRSTVSTWSTAATATTALSWTLSSLTSGITYDWRIKANCPDGAGPYSQSQFNSADAPVCNAPAGLGTSGITTNSATVSWNTVSGAFNYSVEYKLSSNSSWTTMNPVSTINFNFTGLSSGTSYDWRVKTNCSSGTSGYTQSSFTTSSPACNPPSGLTVSSITTGGVTLSWGLVSGAVNYTLEYKLTTSSTWIVASSSLTSTSFNLSGLSAASNYDWRVKANCAAGSSGSTSSTFATATPVCNAPSDLSASSITNNSVTLNWSPVSGAVGYSLEYKLSSSSSWITVPGSLSTTSYSLSNLNSSSNYSWQIKTNCATGGSNFASSTFTTTAPPVCNAPTGLAVSTITSGSANISWSPVSGAINYTVEYKSNSTSTWLTVPGGQTTTSITLNGLNASSVYDWRVKTNCSSGSSGYSTSTFTTAAAVVLTCNAPGNLSTTAITFNSATLNWGAVSGAANYSVEYKLASSSTWTAIPGAMSAASYNLVGLTAGTTYNWQVKTNCSSISSTMTQTTFTTLANANACPGTVDLAENGVRTSAPTIPLNTNVLGKIFPSGDNDYFKFVLTTGGSVACSLTNLPGDYDLRILNSIGTTVGLSQKSNLTSEMVTLSLNAGTYYVRIYGWGTANNNSSCYTLKVQTGASATSNPAGIYSTNELSTTIFPNPVQSALNFDIYGLDASATVTVLDVQNRQLIQTVTKSNLNQLNVSHLAPGFYFLRVEDENKRRTIQKFMKAQ